MNDIKVKSESFDLVMPIKIVVKTYHILACHRRPHSLIERLYENRHEIKKDVLRVFKAGPGTVSVTTDEEEVAEFSEWLSRNLDHIMVEEERKEIGYFVEAFSKELSKINGLNLFWV